MAAYLSGNAIASGSTATYFDVPISGAARANFTSVEDIHQANRTIVHMEPAGNNYYVTWRIKNSSGTIQNRAVNRHYSYSSTYSSGHSTGGTSYFQTGFGVYNNTYQNGATILITGSGDDFNGKGPALRMDMFYMRSSYCVHEIQHILPSTSSSSADWYNLEFSFNSQTTNAIVDWMVLAGV